MHTGSIGAEICEEVYILRSGMRKGIKRILIGVLVLVLLVLGGGIIPSYYLLEVSDYEFKSDKIQKS